MLCGMLENMLLLGSVLDAVLMLDSSCFECTNQDGLPNSCITSCCHFMLSHNAYVISQVLRNIHYIL